MLTCIKSNCQITSQTEDSDTGLVEDQRNKEILVRFTVKYDSDTGLV